MAAAGGRRFTAASLEGAKIHDGCALRSAGEGQGFALQATRWFKQGEEVWRESPPLFLQHFYSAAVAPSCLHCGRLLGTLREVLGWALDARGRSIEQYPDAAESPLLDDKTLQLPRPVCCLHCREARFCSEECRDAQLSGGHHRILCVEMPPERRRHWLRFREYARKHHEAFILAAFAVAQIICSVLHGQTGLAEAVDRLCCYHGAPWQELPPPDAEARPRRVECRLRKLEASLQLLRAALGAPAEFAELLELDFYSRLVGMFDLTTVDITRKHCLEGPLRRALEAAPADVASDLRLVAAEWWLFQERRRRPEQRGCAGANSSQSCTRRERSRSPQRVDTVSACPRPVVARCQTSAPDV